MKKYAMIIDKGECISTLNIFHNGELANRDKWKRLNYYPQSGDVGELIEKSMQKVMTVINSNIVMVDAYILKVSDDIYVPITQYGIKEISEDEAKAKSSSFRSGMNQQQKIVNSEYDKFESGLQGWHNMPGAYYNAFWSDICQILKKHTDDFTIPMYHNELIHECLMYALDMCRHFERTAGEISDNRKEYIASEVCEVFRRNFEEFSDRDAASIMSRIRSINNFESLSANIDSFYNR